MTWYIFPTYKEDRLILLIVITTSLLLRTILYPHLRNLYWILFVDVMTPIVVIYLWVFSLVLFKEHYSSKIIELEKELKRLKKDD